MPDALAPLGIPLARVNVDAEKVSFRTQSPHVDEAKDDTERPEEAAESGAVDAVPVLRCDEVAEKG